MDRIAVTGALGRRQVLALGLAAAGLVACAPKPQPPARFADITFRQFPPIRLAVGQREILRQYRPPERAPNIEHHMPVSPEAMAVRWAEDRLAAAGGPGRVRFLIRDAQVIETPLPRRSGVQGMFRTELSERFEGRLSVAVEVLNAEGRKVGDVAAEVMRAEEMREDATVAERDRLWFTMVETMGRDLNAELDRNIRTILARFVVG
jgi:hypothetical protein